MVIKKCNKSQMVQKTILNFSAAMFRIKDSVFISDFLIKFKQRRKCLCSYT